MIARVARHVLATALFVLCVCEASEYVGLAISMPRFAIIQHPLQA